MENLENYTEDKLTVDVVFANIFSFVLFIPVTAIFAGPFFIIWQDKFPLTNLGYFFNSMTFFGLGWGTGIFFLVLAVGIVIHELIHGICWAMYAPKGFKSIRFGVVWKAITPYCHCNEPLIIKHYIIGGIMPGIVLGIIPAIASLIVGDPGLLSFGIIFTGSAGGDFLMVYKLRTESMDSLVQDHPSEIGCIIYREKNA